MPDGKILDLYLAHRSDLVRYASGIVGDRAHAEDVVQEAYIRFSTPRTGEPILHPVGYLYRIVRNLALDWARRSSAEAVPVLQDQLERVPHDTPTAEDTFLHRDELRALAEALAELPERTQRAFSMYRIEGCTLQEVADRLGISVVRVHQLVREAVLHGARRLDRRRD